MCLLKYVHTFVQVPEEVTQLACVTYAASMAALTWLRHQSMRRFMLDTKSYKFWHHYGHLSLTMLLCLFIVLVPHMGQAWKPHQLLGTSHRYIDIYSCMFTVPPTVPPARSLVRETVSNWCSFSSSPHAGTLAGIAIFMVVYDIVCGFLLARRFGARKQQELMPGVPAVPGDSA